MQFCKVMGVVQYLILTQAYLLFTINKLSQFMHKPTSLHLHHLKHLLRNLKHTINFSICFNHLPSLVCWYTLMKIGVGMLMTKRLHWLTSLFFCGNPISWFLKNNELLLGPPLRQNTGLLAQPCWSSCGWQNFSQNWIYPYNTHLESFVKMLESSWKW